MHMLVCFISLCVCVCVWRSVTASQFTSSLPTYILPLASHTDVAGLAAGVLLGVYCGQAHQLVPADLSHRARRQVDGLGIDHL